MLNQEVRWWLKGYFELCDGELDKKRLQIIKNHFHLCIAVEGELDDFNKEIFGIVTDALNGIEKDYASQANSKIPELMSSVCN